MNTWMIRKNSMRHYDLKKSTVFYSHLNMVDITDADYGHAKRVCKEFEIKNLEQYHDLCVQCSNEQIC